MLPDANYVLRGRGRRHYVREFPGTPFDQDPHQYQVRLRLERARRLLARGDLPVTQVCFESGFESLGSFSSLYRERFGLSPRQAKKQD